jgi:hypothetical protein
MWRYGQVDEQLLHELQKTGEEGCRIYGIWNNLHADVSGDVLGRAWGMTGIIGDVTVFRCRCTSYTRSCEPPTPPPSEATRRAAAALCVRMGPDVCRPRAFPPLAFPPSLFHLLSIFPRRQRFLQPHTFLGLQKKFFGPCEHVCTFFTPPLSNRTS